MNPRNTTPNGSACMQRKPYLRGLPLLLAILVAIWLGLAPASGAANTLQSKQAELKGVQTQIQNKKSSIFRIRRQEKNVLQQLIRTEQDLDKTKERLDSLKSKRKRTEIEIGRSEAELRVAKAELDKTIKRLDGQVSVLRKRLRAIYIRGAGDYLELLFSAKDFTDFVSRFDLLEKIVKQDITLFNKVKAEKEEVARQKATMEDKRAQLVSKRAVLQGIERNVAREQERIADQVQERESALRQIRTKRELEEKALDELEEIAEKINSMITKLIAQNNSGYKPTDTGKMSWPTQGRVTSPYGWRYHPIKKNRRFHYGIDIGAPSGRAVVAARNGVVIFSDWWSGYGKTVIIDHGAGITTLYAHNSVLLAGKGTRVTRGQLIAKVGSTGLSTGPHVHFEVRVGKNTQDPMSWLR